MRSLSSPWQARQVSGESFEPATWHLVQFRRPSRFACALLSGPGEKTSARAAKARSARAAATAKRSAEPDIAEVHRDGDVRCDGDDEKTCQRGVEQAPAAEQLLEALVE